MVNVSSQGSLEESSIKMEGFGELTFVTLRVNMWLIILILNTLDLNMAIIIYYININININS